MRLRLGVSLSAACGAVLLGSSASAIYAPVETRRVPVGRLITNLERKLAEDPRNIQNHINLGRLHGMAFALKTEEAVAAGPPGSPEERPWYGHEPKLIPYPHRPASSPEADAAAREHLTKALTYYQAALELDPSSLLAQLGYAWLLDQSGEDRKAIEIYRQVILQAWPAEKQSAKVIMPGQRLFSYEAIDYLVPLLDPQKDAAEIQELRARKHSIDSLPRAVTPIAIPLRDGLLPSQIHDPSSRVRFDADGSGLQRDWTWIGTDAGWLVFDTDGTGQITSALQMFGNVTFWLFWDNGYQALSALDDNRDGAIADEELRQLAIWRDANSNGIAEHGEVAPLSKHGIVALSCKYEAADDETFAAVSSEGVRLTDGRTRPTYDVLLRRGRSWTMTRPAPGVNRAILQERAHQQEHRE